MFSEIQLDIITITTTEQHCIIRILYQHYYCCSIAVMLDFIPGTGWFKLNIIIDTSYQKLPFGSGDYPDKLVYHQALN